MQLKATHLHIAGGPFFTRPLLPEGSSLQVEILSVCLSVIASIFPIYGLQIIPESCQTPHIIHNWKEYDISDDNEFFCSFSSSVMSILSVFLKKSQKSDFFEWLIRKRNVVLWATSKILLFNGAKCIHSSLFLEQSQFSFAIFRTFIEPVLHTHTQKKLQWLKYI